MAEIDWQAFLDFNTAAPQTVDDSPRRISKSIAECLDDFRAQMVADGLVVGEVVCDGVVKRVPVEDKRSGKLNGWYVFYHDQIPTGVYGRWDTDAKVVWSAVSEREMSEEERARQQYMVERAKRDREEKARADQAKAAALANALWAKASPCEDHPYLKRKGVTSHGLRVNGGALLVPMMNENAAIVNIQRVFPQKLSTGTDKLFLPGGKTKGVLFHYIPGDKARIAIGEGYSTMATVREATGRACIVCFTKLNLPHVAKWVREKAGAEADIIITGDYDRDGGGQRYAAEAAKVASARCFIPGGIEYDEGSDFNDLAAMKGLDEVRRQLAPADTWEINPFEFSAARWEGEPRTTEWLIDATFPIGKVSLFAAAGGAGKSMLLLDLAAKVAFGAPSQMLPGDAPDRLTAFGRPIQRHGKVLMYLHEDDSDEVHSRLWNMGYRDYNDNLICITLPDANKELVIVERSEKGNPSRGSGVQEVERHISAIKPVLVVFDPLANFVMADLDSQNEHAVFSMGVFAGLARKHNCCMITTHHFNKEGVDGGKDKGGQNSRASVRGATGLVDRARTVYTLYRMAPQEANELAKYSGIDHAKYPDTYYCGVVAKTNLASNKAVTKFQRNPDTGLLEEIPLDVLSQVRMTKDMAESIIINAIAAQAGIRPYECRIHNSESPKGRENEFDGQALAVLGLTSKQKWADQIAKWVSEGRLVEGVSVSSKGKKILDAPEGYNCVQE